MTGPRWLSGSAIRLLHLESLREFGGAEGVRDDGLLDSALARPLDLHAYEDERDRCRLATAYAVGIVRNHPFVDGNKRAALAAVGVFLVLNGLDLVANQAEAAVAVMDLAAGDLPEEGFAAWLRDNATPRA